MSYEPKIEINSVEERIDNLEIQLQEIKENKTDSVAQPVLGAAQPQTQQPNTYVYISIVALIF